MFTPERYDELKALGYTQEPHRIPMYKILYTINYLREHEKLATSSRIAETINKYQQYVTFLLNVYWRWKYVKKKLVKTTKKRTRSAGKSVFHWDLTKSGERKLERLAEEFGGMVKT